VPVIPFRGLSEKGILSDPGPYQLDLNAWSGGSNVRFHGNKVARSPIWRTVTTALPSPANYCWGYRPSTGQDLLFLTGDDGHLYSFASNTVLDVSPTGVTVEITKESLTSTYSGDVTYLNSPTSGPLYYGPGSTQFALLPGWNSTWVARSMRAFGSYVVALNVTKGAVQLSNLVKWSDIVLAGMPPASWDSNDPTTSAGENPLQDLTTPLVDGLPMRSIFVLYSENQIWGMTPSGDNFIFDFQRLFSEGGMISPNCAVEVEGRHYVFGPTDVYVHDGVSKQSILDGRNRETVYSALDTNNTEACYVSYNPALNEITFAYPSGTGTEFFQNLSGTTYANRGAVYSVTTDTWSFVDLPNVPQTTLVNIETIPTYATESSTITYATVGGSYFSDQNSYTQTCVGVSRPVTTGNNLIPTPAIVAYDFVNLGKLNYPYDPLRNGLSFVQRTGIDMEQVGSDTHTYKVARRMFPLIELYRNAAINIKIGYSMTPSGVVKWGSPLPFNPEINYHVDMRSGGRYLAVQFGTTAQLDFNIEGFDLDVTPWGTR